MRTALPLLLAGLVACLHPPDDGDDDSAPGADTDTEAAPGGVVGILRVQTFQPDGGTADPWAAVSAWGLLDSPFPAGFYGEYSTGFKGQRWAVVLEEGPCALVAPTEGGVCEPPCEGDGICGFDGACFPAPVPADAGPIAFTGLGTEVALEPTGAGYYDTVTLAADAVVQGAEVCASAAGGATPAFSVCATVSAPLEPALPCDVGLVAAGSLTWTPADEGARVRLQADSILHAANGPGLICETDDVGSLTVPTDLLAAYRTYHGDLSVWQLTRLRRAEVEVRQGQRVLLEVGTVRACE